MTPSSGSSQRVGGSFRDPSGYVFHRDSKIFRAVNAESHKLQRELEQQGTWAALLREGLVVETHCVDDPALVATLAGEHPGYQHFFEHRRLDRLSYPYEWSFTMLVAAARLTLQLQERLIAAGYSLKDATPYNVQFVAGRPVFIDITSIERPARLDVWFALGQFQRMFLLPLLLNYYQGGELRSYYLSHINGRSTTDVARALGGWNLCRPALWLDLTLPWWLERSHQNSAPVSTKPKPRTAALPASARNPAAQRFNLRRLSRKLDWLERKYRPGGLWADYTKTCTYDDRAESAKKSLIRAFLAKHQPATVLDLGCNTGDYSVIAAESGANVVAADSDSPTVDLLFRRIRGGAANILPLNIDLVNPSPAIGHLNEERESFLERHQADCVFALALIHHLLVSGNLSLTGVRDCLAKLAQNYLVLEFVPVDDPMFQRLLEFRENLYEHVTLAAVKEVFATEFELLDEQAIENSPRTMLFFRKRPDVQT